MMIILYIIVVNDPPKLLSSYTKANASKILSNVNFEIFGW